MFGLISSTEHPNETYRFCPKRGNGWGCIGVVLLDTFVDANFQESIEFGLTLCSPKEDFSMHPDWPVKCDYCGEPFPNTALKFVDSFLEYRKPNSLDTYILSGHSDTQVAGMLYEGWWLHFNKQKKEDNIYLIAITPNGHHWHVDGEATGGGFWSRIGDPKIPESLSVSPSILVGDYHGFLQNGRFTDDLGS